MHIHVITHALDDVGRRERYMLAPILSALQEDGHTIAFSRGVTEEPAPADLAILHVDLTVVPGEYADFAARFPTCINRNVSDISKRKVSDAALLQDDDWAGRVLVKANLNCAGIPERRAGLITGLANASRIPDQPAQFAVYRSIRMVPKALIEDPDLVVERFVPEQVDGLFACRFWTFSGDVERCARVFTREPIVKASGQVRFEFCDVPDVLRVKRRELGFDYGKFDFVIHEGEVILLDANKTPGTPPVSKQSQWPVEFAQGLLRLAG
jgi:hypothetical protein